MNRTLLTPYGIREDILFETIDRVGYLFYRNTNLFNRGLPNLQLDCKSGLDTKFLIATGELRDEVK